MLIVFCLPLAAIAIYETQLDPSKNRWVHDWLSHPDQGLEDTPEYRDPEVDGEDAAKGLKISTVPFDDIVKVFPDSTHVSSSAECLPALAVTVTAYSPRRRRSSRRSGT